MQLIFKIQNSYTVNTNGYLLIIPETIVDGNIKINSTVLDLVNEGIIILPVKESDVVTSTISIKEAFFLPVTEINIENF